MGYSGRVTKRYSCVCNLHTADYFYPLCCKTKENSRCGKTVFLLASKPDRAFYFRSFVIESQTHAWFCLFDGFWEGIGSSF